ncbi:hypothetical protein MLD38_003934 [Melastoma candidum]|uniref:Uncharacterized protein n=1 Tax=Melastoma candidum TaxID=119954 RepID=A0ACB9S3K8_9MYRT|nr:hypothetical protein MLD38_003934 [Melastoma candidum]
MANIGTARVRVNCSAVRFMQKTIEEKGEDGAGIKVDVYYENVPINCKECKVFGHSMNQCLIRKPRSRSRSKGPQGRSGSSRPVRNMNSRDAYAGEQNSSARNSGVELQALTWRESGTVEVAGQGGNGEISIWQWKRSTLNNVEATLGTAEAVINISRELIPSIPTENRWTLIPFEGDQVECIGNSAQEDSNDAGGGKGNQ